MDRGPREQPKLLTSIRIARNWKTFSNIATVRHWVMHLGIPEEKRALHEQKKALGLKALGVMERHLEGRPYFVADRCTVADLALYAYTHVAPEGGFDLAPYPRIRAWLDRVADRPGFTPITQK